VEAKSLRFGVLKTGTLILTSNVLFYNSSSHCGVVINLSYMIWSDVSSHECCVGLVRCRLIHEND